MITHTSQITSLLWAHSDLFWIFNSYHSNLLSLFLPNYVSNLDLNAMAGDQWPIQESVSCHQSLRVEQTLSRRGDRAPVLVRTKSRKAGDGNFSNQSLQIWSPSVQAPAHDEMGTGRGTGGQWRAATQSEAGEQRGDSPRPDHIPQHLIKFQKS